MARIADAACLPFILQVEKCVDTLKLTSTPATPQVQAWRRQLAGSTGLRPKHLLLSNEFYNYSLLAAPDVAGLWQGLWQSVRMLRIHVPPNKLFNTACAKASGCWVKQKGHSTTYQADSSCCSTAFRHNFPDKL
jgi:hypothetical protein